jgi:LysR family glycine cleavage system transcriptional activator
MKEKRGHVLPPLNALRALDAFAQCGSLRAAATELGVVPGAVRQQLSGLDEYFGTSLFIRHGGRVALNPAGKRLADAVGVALTIIERAAEEISSESERLRLRLGVPMPMAAAWFIPRLPLLLAERRTLDIDIVPISVTSTLSDMPELDAMIVGGEYRPLPDVVATSFMADEFGPVTGAEFATTASLESMTAIVARNVPYLWDDWFRESGIAPVRFRKRNELEDLTLAISAAKAGLGITIAPRASIEAELASGELSAPFGFVTRPSGYRLCCRVTDSDRKPVASLRSWLVREGQKRSPSEENLPL